MKISSWVSVLGTITWGAGLTDAQSSGTQTCSSKRGAAYDDASAVQSLATNAKISWAYNWKATANGNLDVEYVPMAWGAKELDISSALIEQALGHGSTHVLGFNEPDHKEQSDMNPSDAARNYRKYLTPIANRATLVSPAVTNADGIGLGLNWMTQFLEECRDCGITIMAIHWYGETAEDFKEYVKKAQILASSFGLKEVWVTEFALKQVTIPPPNQHDPNTTVSAMFLQSVLPWLDQNCGIGRYAYFMWADRNLLNGGQLSESGEAYLA
jgi:hypothetical protein